MKSSRTGNWSQLSAGMKRYYRNRGIEPGTYNAWYSLPQSTRASITRNAQAAGWDSGLQFYGARAQVLQHEKGTKTSRYIQPADLPEREAVRRLLRGQRGRRELSQARARVSKAVPRTQEFRGHLDWEEFMSPLS